jgi:hypothetical protein
MLEDREDRGIHPWSESLGLLDLQRLAASALVTIKMNLNHGTTKLLPVLPDHIPRRLPLSRIELVPRESCCKALAPSYEPKHSFQKHQ